MITLTGNELYGIIQPLANFCQDYKLPIKASYRLARILKRAQDEFKILDEQRIALVKTYGQVQEDGNYKIDETNKENFENFKKRVDELLSEEIKIDLEPINFDLLGNLDVKPSELFILQKLFEGEV